VACTVGDARPNVASRLIADDNPGIHNSFGRWIENRTGNRASLVIGLRMKHSRAKKGVEERDEEQSLRPARRAHT
jgi:hypothetical protein